LLEGKRVLITGGTGSFGNAAVERLLSEDVALVRILSRDEYKQTIMKRVFSDSKLEFFIGDIRDTKRVIASCRDIDLILHAAALKHVPVCEDNVSEAIKTNVLGTMNVIDAAIQRRVNCVINLSPDKAIYASSVYGATKFLAEKLFIRANLRSSSRFVNVRYSNVFASRGSVVEIFHERLNQNEKIQVFDEKMIRFFLTQTEVVDLCLFIWKNAVGGETYVKISKPIQILRLAKVMAQMAGKGEVEVLKGSKREGERLDTALLSLEESSNTFKLEDIYIINNLDRDLPLNNLEKIEQKTYTTTDFELMPDHEIKRLIREELVLKS